MFCFLFCCCFWGSSLALDTYIETRVNNFVFTFFAFKDGYWEFGVVIVTLLDIPMSEIKKPIKDAGIEQLSKFQISFLY